jgi:ornithine cyclodeaminase/alanine dehydrogenase-like protein (mu-crystallin family)
VLERAIPGRTSATEITLFDSTGLAIQDAAVARVVYERAVKAGLGAHVDLVARAGDFDVLQET